MPKSDMGLSVSPGDVSQGSLSPEQVSYALDVLTRHFGERVAPVSDYCQGFYDWRDAINAKLKRIKAGEEDDYADLALNEWERVSSALSLLSLVIGKSSMLNRRIYGGEKLRTEMCPEHRGRWTGLPFGPTSCGCDLTGWLPAKEA